MSDSDSKTPEQMWAHYAQVKSANPVAAARWALQVGLHDLPRPADAPANRGDANARIAELRPVGLAPGIASELPPEDPRSVHAELQKTNPALASRYAIANGIYE